MAKFVLKTAGVKINGTDLSDHISEVTIENTKDEVDVTGFTASSFREFTTGFRDATITMTAFQDYAGTSIDAVCYPMFNNDTDGTVLVRESSASTVVHSMICKLYSYSPIAGAVGDAATTELVFRPTGTTGITRGTTF